MLRWKYAIPDLNETFIVEAEDVATLLELRSAVLDTASRLAHNDAVLLGNLAAVRCDICDTWVATHTITAHNITYNVCDKPRCQEHAHALVREEQGADHETR